MIEYIITDGRRTIVTLKISQAQTGKGGSKQMKKEEAYNPSLSSFIKLFIKCEKIPNL